MTKLGLALLLSLAACGQAVENDQIRPINDPIGPVGVDGGIVDANASMVNFGALTGIANGSAGLLLTGCLLDAQQDGGDMYVDVCQRCAKNVCLTYIDLSVSCIMAVEQTNVECQ